MQVVVIRVPSGMKGLSTTFQSLSIAVRRWIPFAIHHKSWNVLDYLEHLQASQCKRFSHDLEERATQTVKVNKVGF